MATGKINMDTVKAVPIPPEGKREHLWDDALKGFGLMVTDKGARSYILQYRVGGRGSPTRRVTIGKHGSPWTPKTARDRAQELLEQVRRKVDPFDAEREAVAKAKKAKADEKARAVILAKLSFDTIANRYIKHGTFDKNKKRIRTWGTYKKIVERDLIPHFGSKPITDIPADDISEFLKTIAERGDSAARRAHIVLANIFSYAAKDQPRHFKAKNSPMAEVAAPTQAAVRQYHLPDDLLRYVWKAAGGMGWPWSDIIRQLILSGQRLREVAHVPWPELNLKEQVWIIPGDRTKNGHPHLVPVTATGLAIWKELPSIKNDANLVFPTGKGTAQSAISKMKKKLDGKILALMQEDAKAAGADEDELAALSIPDWRLHDLRRTASVGMQRCGVAREVIDEVLNHKIGGVTGVYQVYRFEPEKREALNKWDGLLANIVRGQDAQVIQMRGVA